jgi:hypothetical protein
VIFSATEKKNTLFEQILRISQMNILFKFDIFAKSLSTMKKRTKLQHNLILFVSIMIND